MIRKFFGKKVFEPHNSVDSIEDLPQDSEEELDRYQYPQQPPEPKIYPEPQPQPHGWYPQHHGYPQPQEYPQPQGYSQSRGYPQPQRQELIERQDFQRQDEQFPSTSRTFITIRINPLDRPFSNIYGNIESPVYDTYSEESKDHEEMTPDRSKSNKTEDSREDLKKLRRVDIEPFSIDEQDASESCVVKCFCMRRRR